MFSICFCDDTPATLHKYIELFELIAERHQIPVSIRAFSSGEEFLAYLENPNHFFDLYFVEAGLKDISGIDTVLRIHEYDPWGLVIFLGVRAECASDCFAAYPFNYIIKSKLNFIRGESVFLNATRFSSKKRSRTFKRTS